MMARVQLVVVLVAVLLFAACRVRSPGSQDRSPAGNSVPSHAVDAQVSLTSGRRLAMVVAPPGRASAVLLVLHGYGDDGSSLAAALDLPALARRAGFVLVVPEGTLDARGRRFWNATDACCNFFGSAVDDVAYLRGLIRAEGERHRVPRGRGLVLGFSNGAFMAQRLACEAADDIAAIVSMGGSTWVDAARCRPGKPVSVLQIHGDADSIIRYEGGSGVLGISAGAYPGVVEVFARWMHLDGCQEPTTPEPPQLGSGDAPAQAHTERVARCPRGVDVRLLSFHGARHAGIFGPAVTDHIARWLISRATAWEH